jgi:hypothetical protein
MFQGGAFQDNFQNIAGVHPDLRGRITPSDRAATVTSSDVGNTLTSSDAVVSSITTEDS